MEAPRVLVVMPLYNARPYLRPAIEAVLAQTYRNFILLIINDGSTDGSNQDAAAYQERGVLIWHQANQGPGPAMNRAIEYAAAEGIEFIARVDADDLALPERLEKQIALLRLHPRAAACSANCYYIHPQSEQVIGTTTVPVSDRLIRWEIRQGLRGLIQPVCTFRTEPLRRISGYRPHFKLAEEVDVFLRLAEGWELCNHPAYLARVRLNPTSLSMKNVRANILYQFYALECAQRRRRGQAEREYAAFAAAMPWPARFGVWREELLLKYWRAQMGRKGPASLLLAALLDPRRVLARVLRKLEEHPRPADPPAVPPEGKA